MNCWDKFVISFVSVVSLPVLTNYTKAISVLNVEAMSLRNVHTVKMLKASATQKHTFHIHMTMKTTNTYTAAKS
jgi:hypothetical protein